MFTDRETEQSKDERLRAMTQETMRQATELWDTERRQEARQLMQGHLDLLRKEQPGFENERTFFDFLRFAREVLGNEAVPEARNVPVLPPAVQPSTPDPRREKAMLRYQTLLYEYFTVLEPERKAQAATFNGEVMTDLEGNPLQAKTKDSKVLGEMYHTVKGLLGHPVVPRESIKITGDLPINGTVTSRYGERWDPVEKKKGKYVRKFHAGIDISAREGTRVPAIHSGTVKSVGDRSDGYGKSVYVEVSRDGRHSLVYSYHHLSGYGPAAVVGKPVERGDILGLVGSTGHSTGPHLHYNIWVDGKTVNPIGFDWPE